MSEAKTKSVTLRELLSSQVKLGDLHPPHCQYDGGHVSELNLLHGRPGFDHNQDRRHQLSKLITALEDLSNVGLNVEFLVPVPDEG